MVRMVRYPNILQVFKYYERTWNIRVFEYDCSSIIISMIERNADLLKWWKLNEDKFTFVSKFIK